MVNFNQGRFIGALVPFLFLLNMPGTQGQEMFTRADSLRGQLGPMRTCYDVYFYDLALSVDPVERTVQGSNKIYFHVKEETKALQFDLFEELTIHTITNEKGSKLKFERDGNAVFIYPSRKLKIGDSEIITIEYGGKPVSAKNPPWDGGLIWRKDLKGNPWVTVACQGLGASSWWPNKDHGSDEPDSMRITVTVPADLMNISNGRLRSVREQANGWTSYEWFVHHPINNYSVTMNIGEYAHYQEWYVREAGDSLSLDYYVLPENLGKARAQFSQTMPMLQCFESYFGPYPFPEDGFKVVEVPYAGMEHQSAIAYGNGFANGYYGQSGSKEGMWFDFILIHEAGHEWFGNSITSSDIADMWIHEGFTTYMEGVYVECLYGYEAAMNYMEGMEAQILLDQPIVGVYGVHKEGSRDMYPKAALMLNTLRHVVRNDTLWWNALYDLTTTFRHQVVNYQQVTDFMSLRLRMDCTSFFEQYLKHVDLPELELKWIKDNSGGRLAYRWKVDVASFNVPVRVKVDDDIYWLRATAEWNSLEIKRRNKPNVRLDRNWLARVIYAKK